MAAANKIKVPMSFSKSTKGTHVYQADDPDAFIPTVYIKKAAMTDPAKQITLIVETSDAADNA